MGLDFVTDGEGSLDATVQEALHAIEDAMTRGVMIAADFPDMRLPYTTLVRGVRQADRAYDLLVNSTPLDGFSMLRGSLMDAREFWRLLPHRYTGPVYTGGVLTRPAPDFDSLITRLDTSGSDDKPAFNHTLNPKALDVVPILIAKGYTSNAAIADKCQAYDAMVPDTADETSLPEHMIH